MGNKVSTEINMTFWCCSMLARMVEGKGSRGQAQEMWTEKHWGQAEEDVTVRHVM